MGADIAAEPIRVELPNASLALVAALNQHLKFLHQSIQPRDQGGIENEKGMSFSDLVARSMSVELCEALTCELAGVRSSCSPAAKYVRTIL